MMKATAVAHPNIALVKYWGKRNASLNLPAAGSFSLTLAGLTTRTTVRFDKGYETDMVMMGERALGGPKRDRISRFLDRVRAAAGIQLRATVNTHNDFPTAAGVASSASGFAALAAASTRALNLDMDTQGLSVLARLGSGSAARSVFGGFVEMLPGKRSDGSDAHAVPVLPEDHWDLVCFVVLTTSGEKPMGSTEAMNLTAKTSPFYQAWVDSVSRDIGKAKMATMQRDFRALGTVAEHSCLKFHASAIAADPGILYWRGLTVELIHHVRRLRETGIEVFFTIDAGPHVKVFCQAPARSAVRGMLLGLEGVSTVLEARPGPGVRIERPDGTLEPY
jgi:diphosphomevalonate decarboxylase